MNNEHIIPALDKALSLLERLGRHEGGATQAELSAKVGITQSTCYRILQTLQRHDFVRKQSGGRFDISGGLLSAAMRLADRAKRFERAQPLLEDLSAKTGFSCKLSLRQGFEQLSILRAESPLAVSVSGKVGSRFPLIEGSVGAALLCDETPEALAELSSSCAEDIAEREVSVVQSRIDGIRKNGYALNSQENRWNVEAMSAPVRDSEGQAVAALTLLGFKDEFKDLPSLSKALLQTARKISASL